MEQNKDPETLRREMEAEIAANEAEERNARRRLIRNIIVGAVIVAAIIGAWVALQPHHEPEVYYKDGDIDWVKQADKLRRSGKFKEVDAFKNGFVVVSDGKKYGIADVKGNIVCPMKYDAIESSYSQHYPDMAEVRLNGKLGLVDKQGHEAIKPVYDELGPISNGIIEVTQDKETFYVDTHGNRVKQ